MSGVGAVTMAAKVWGTQQRAVEEIFFQNEAVSLCLLVNRRARTMRVIDFRAGPTHAKRLFVLSLAQREGMSKVYTLVERDEVQTWMKLGFAKEGNIPGFYKRSDAFLARVLGAAAGRGRRAGLEHPEEIPVQSEMRLAVAGASPPLTAAQERMERTIAARPRRGLKDGARARCPHAKIAPSREAEARKAVAAALRSGRALTGVRALRPGRRAPLLRGDRARRLRAPRLDRVAGVLRQRVPRAPAVARERRPRSSARGRAPRVLRQARGRGRRQLLLARPERRRGARLGVPAKRLSAHGPAPGAPLRARRAQGRDRVVAQAREPGRRVARAAIVMRRVPHATPRRARRRSRCASRSTLEHAGKASSELEVEDTRVLLALAGPRNERLKILEREASVAVGLRGNKILLGATPRTSRWQSASSRRRRPCCGRA